MPIPAIAAIAAAAHPSPGALVSIQSPAKCLTQLPAQKTQLVSGCLAVLSVLLRDYGISRPHFWSPASTYSPLGVLSRAHLAAGSVQGNAPHPEQQILAEQKSDQPS
jgi:hypothetical protein